MITPHSKTEEWSEGITDVLLNGVLKTVFVSEYGDLREKGKIDGVQVVLLAEEVNKIVYRLLSRATADAENEAVDLCKRHYNDKLNQAVQAEREQTIKWLD